MTSVGDTLRRERLQRKLDLDQISHELKISRRMLDAIEADQYERLPGGVFAKAFVRQYAGMLGLDAEELAAQVQRAMAPPSSFDSEERAKPALNPIEVPRVRVEEWTTLGDKGRSSGSLPAAVLVVVAMLICSAVYAWMQRPKTAPAAHVTRPPQTHSEPAPAPAPLVATPPVQSAQGAPHETPATPTTQGAIAPPQPAGQQQGSVGPQQGSPAGPVHVEMAADDAVWVLVRVDGKFAYTGVIDAGVHKVFDGTKDVQVRLGNAGGMTISLNGKPIGSAGPKGQVRNVQFTSGGFQIESPKPPVAAPLDPLDR
ncbi:MAG TPA: RodZ domain-containing protein [Candidatus Acidoferrum sp.]|nr:RodZ domain-containing protein [Candidatus Acidoferrum sp.]